MSVSVLLIHQHQNHSCKISINYLIIGSHTDVSSGFFICQWNIKTTGNIDTNIGNMKMPGIVKLKLFEPCLV